VQQLTRPLLRGTHARERARAPKTKTSTGLTLDGWR